MLLIRDKMFVRFLLKFLLSFCILYYGTIAFIGLTVPGGYYWKFGSEHLDYVSGLRYILLHASRLLLQLVGYEIYLKDVFTIRVQNGAGVHVGYDCIGYGVMIFWIAFIYANQISFKKKIAWMLSGLAIIWTINVLRICIMLVAVNNKWPALFGMDNHTWFNIVCYGVIFIMIYKFDQSEKQAMQQGEDGKQA